MAAKRWEDLKSDAAMVRALDVAEARVPRAVAVKGDRETRNKWSNAFADACARMLADEARRHDVFRRLVVLPEEGKTAEPPTFVSGGQTKKVDVVVSSLVSGLQVGFSLKGMNFRDRGGAQFAKNLSGRTYELRAEVRMIHEYQPASLLVAVYFLPLASTVDKKSHRKPSSFAQTVQHLRARTGRLDPTLPSQLDRLDLAAVGLYVPGDSEPEFDYEDPFERGVVRYLDVQRDPPRRGRPMIGSTMDLAGLIDWIAGIYEAAGDPPIAWADPEPD